MLSKTFFSVTAALICATAGRAQITLNPVPTREIGQPKLEAIPSNINPNLVEGREFFNPMGIALDTSVTPPRIFVADTRNNRILGWKDAVNFTNGKMADLVIGQLDFYSTGPNSTGHSVSTGFNSPTGLAVDQGDLYVADSGNNRILGFRKPFATPPGQLSPAVCIGQGTFSSKIANYPQGLLTDQGIALNPFTAAITFDSLHNLWLTDAGNRRVLRYAAADVAKGTLISPVFGLTANLEIGQRAFFLPFLDPSPTAAQAGQLLNVLATPAAIAFDTAGRLYIADSDGGAVNRVLVFLPPFQIGMKADRVMGIQPATAAGVTRTDPQIFSIAMASPSTIFFLPGTQGMGMGVGVVDSGFSRILIFDPYESWPDAATAVSPSAKAVFGHPGEPTIPAISSTDTKSLVANDGNPLPGPGTLAGPQAAVFDNVRNELYVADTYNNRVTVLLWQSGNFAAATRVLGQDFLTTNSVNLIEGREFSFNGSLGSDSSVVIDSMGDTPHLYVSDPYNNRVLGFRDVRKLIPGSTADIVIGQPDLATAICNYHPTSDPSDPKKPTQSSLCRPLGLLVDATGNLYVADSLNGRVLRFPTPFSHGNNPQADLVLGKSSFSLPPNPGATKQNMSVPYGLAFAGPNATVGLLVSDQFLNRVLFFPFTNGTFSAADNGAPATMVFGQPDFTSQDPHTSDTGMSNPHHLSSDTSGLIYVVDSGNGRVMVFGSVADPFTPPADARAFYFASPGAEGIFVNSTTGEIWVTDAGGNVVRGYPRYDLLINALGKTEVILSNAPLAVTQDKYGDLIVAEAVNRVTFYYPKLYALNLANSVLNKPLAPNTIASMYPAGIQFGTDTADAYSLPNPLPLPTTMADIQVTVNGTPAPLYYVSPTQINFIVPWNAPTTGAADVQVLKVSTGQLLAASPIPMNVVSPGIFANVPAGVGANLAAVINQDGTVNSASNPAKVGSYIAIWATGQGSVDSPPADGDIPRNGLVKAQGNLRVWLGSDYLDQIQLLGDEQRSIPGADINFIQFSGLSPGFPGMWQINVRIPQATAVGANVLSLLYNNVPDNLAAVTGYKIVFYVAAPK